MGSLCQSVNVFLLRLTLLSFRRKFFCHNFSIVKIPGALGLFFCVFIFILTTEKVNLRERTKNMQKRAEGHKKIQFLRLFISGNCNRSIYYVIRWVPTVYLKKKSSTLWQPPTIEISIFFFFANLFFFGFVCVFGIECGWNNKLKINLIQWNAFGWNRKKFPKEYSDLKLVFFLLFWRGPITLYNWMHLVFHIACHSKIDYYY